jgi:hypothetical protein
MKRISWLKKSIALPLAAGLVIAATAWQVHPGNTQHRTETDTIPERNKRVKDIDDALDQLDKGQLQVEKSLDAIDWKEIQKNISESMKQIDMAKIQMDIDKAMKEVDMKKIQANIDQAMKAVDMEKINANMSKTLTEVDGEKVKAEIEKAMKEVDMQKIKAGIDASISKIDMDKIKVEMQKVKDVDMKKLQEEMEKMKPEIEKSMTEARTGIDKAKKDLLAYKGLIDGLDKEGLINKKENYKIEYKAGVLTINGKKQSADVVKKYQNFLKDRKDFTIKKDAEGFDIDND